MSELARSWRLVRPEVLTLAVARTTPGRTHCWGLLDHRVDPHWHAITGSANDRRTGLFSASGVMAEVVPDDSGIWEFYCHVVDHIAVGVLSPQVLADRSGAPGASRRRSQPPAPNAVEAPATGVDPGAAPCADRFHPYTGAWTGINPDWPVRWSPPESTMTKLSRPRCWSGR